MSKHGPSFLRWAGSKRKSLDVIAATCTDSTLRYIEPFAGSACLFFRLRPQRALLADLNRQLINALHQLKSNPSALYAELASLPRNEKAFYLLRDEFNEPAADGLRSAVLFIYLNRNCFNGLWRTNKNGSFNVPWGGGEMGENPPPELLDRCSEALEAAELRNQDFRDTLKSVGAGDYVYADPPYFTAKERTFIEYGTKSFGRADLDELLSLLVDAARKGARIALTYHGAEALSLPLNWTATELRVIRNVGGFSHTRKTQTEVLYSSPA